MQSVARCFPRNYLFTCLCHSSLIEPDGFIYGNKIKYKNKNITVALNSCLKERLHFPCPLCTGLPNVPLQLLQAHSHTLAKEAAHFCTNWLPSSEMARLHSSLATSQLFMLREKEPPLSTPCSQLICLMHMKRIMCMTLFNTANTRSSEQEIISFRKGY